MTPLQEGQFHRGDAEGTEETRRNSGENLREAPRRRVTAPPRLRGEPVGFLQESL